MGQNAVESIAAHILCLTLRTPERFMIHKP